MTMRHTRLLICVSVLAVAVPAAPAEYELVWAEAFDGLSIDKSIWTRDTYHGVVRSAEDAGFYTDRPANVRVEDGVLKIVARKEAYDLAAFTTARLHTYGKRAFTFGRFSVRMKAPAVPGLRPQVSLLPVELAYGSWPASGEIVLLDVVDGASTSGLHFGGCGPRGTHVQKRYPKAASGESADGYHVYTVEWQPYEIRWFVDDKLVAVQSRWRSAAAPHPAPFDRPFYLALGMAVVSPGAAQLDDWPYAMQVDWIRVYQARGNRAPLVKLTDPAPGATLPAARRIPIRAEASDPDDNLAGVAFYSDDKRLAVDREAPFAFDWSPPDGCYLVSARAFDEDGFARTDSVEITVGRGCPPTPFHGTPAAVPGRIEAEDFDKSRKNEAYYDTDAANHGGAYRTASAVDIQPCSDGGFNLGWMIDNEWTRYTVVVATTGEYDVRCRVASPHDTARIRLEIDGDNITGSLAIPNTGDWQNFADVVVRGVRLAAGERVLRMVVEVGGLNLDYIEFVPHRQDERAGTITAACLRTPAS
jgi:beta-glucanase (GH16 family)